VPGVPQAEPVGAELVVPVLVVPVLVVPVLVVPVLVVSGLEVVTSGLTSAPAKLRGYTVVVTVVVAVEPVVTVLVTVAVLVTGAPVSVTVTGAPVSVTVMGGAVLVRVSVVVLVAVALAWFDVRQTPPEVHAAAGGRACALASTSIGPAITAESAAHPSKTPRSCLLRGIIFMPSRLSRLGLSVAFCAANGLISREAVAIVAGQEDTNSPDLLTQGH
jgi:hypothetical protein